MELPDNPYTYLIVIGIGLAILELVLGAATAFELLVIGIIFVISGFLGMATNSFTVSIVSIIVLCLLYFLAGRKMIRKTLNITTTATNVDAIIGQKAMVVKAITPAEAGQVKVNGEIWRASADQAIAAGVRVSVDGVSGVTLSVSVA